jgi:hypothetical protein
MKIKTNEAGPDNEVSALTDLEISEALALAIGWES